jgi:hypothetical protein
MSNETDFNHPKWVAFSQMTCKIISLINLLLVLFMIIIILKNKTYSMMTTLSIHSGIGVIFHSISYLLTQDEDSFSCKIISVIHFCTLILLIHVFFIYYLLTLLMSFKWGNLRTCYFQFVIYLINWIIIAAFAILVATIPNIVDDLQVCRPEIGDPRSTTGSVYMIVMLSSTCVMYVIMRIKISKSIND